MSTTSMNRALADQCRDLADQHPGASLERRAAACCAVALRTTGSVKAARAELTGYLEGDVLAAALAVLAEVTEKGTE